MTDCNNNKMKMKNKINILKYWLCNFTDDFNVNDLLPHDDDDVPKNVWDCNHWVTCINESFDKINEILYPSNAAAAVATTAGVQTDGGGGGGGGDFMQWNSQELLQIAISSIQLFVQENFLGPPPPQTIITAKTTTTTTMTAPTIINNGELNGDNIKKPTTTMTNDESNSQNESSAFVYQAFINGSRNLLKCDGVELNVNVKNFELLALSEILFRHLLEIQYEPLIVNWWYTRCLYIHQQCLDELCITLYSDYFKYTTVLVSLIDELIVNGKLNGDHDDDDDDGGGTSNEITHLKALFLLEALQGFVVYRRIWKAEQYLNELKKILLATVTVEGFLGVRTKYQQKPLPQLNLKIEIGIECPLACETHKHTQLPILLKLDDDVRLEKIRFVSDVGAGAGDGGGGGAEIDHNKTQELSSVVQVFVLSIVKFLQQSQPKDELADEELQPYITTLLYQETGPWVTRITTLLLNIHLEATHKRTVERSLKQCEDIVNAIDRTHIGVAQRFSYAYASYIEPKWKIREQFGSLLVSLGLIKTALDLYLHIQNWHEVINCYTILELRHKAAEIIQQELDKKPTVELLCLMGDATDNLQYYEDAWEFSNRKSGRAQRHWGNYYFAHKNYAKSIEHLQKSLELNSIQETVWARLGFAAIAMENWELAASAYRRYTQIEPHGFESWNNLAKAYIKLGEKERAQKILHEALKCNYNNWKVWENFLIVSVDTGHFDDVIIAYNRLIELKDKYYDKEILEIIVNAVVKNIPDADGIPSERLIKKAKLLLGHLCVQFPSDGLIWEYSAMLCVNEPLARAQKLQKSYRGYSQIQNPWAKNHKTCEKVLKICEQLCLASLDAISNHKDTEKSIVLSQLSSARLSAQGSIRAVLNEKWTEFDENIKILNDLLERIKNALLNHL